VLQNLISNAFRFTPSGKKVEAVFTEENGSLTVRVVNEGSFIEEREREAVFDKFYDVWADRSSKSWSNHGLGLTFSRMAVHAMGGEIGVTCDREGPSTAFYFTIPR
jgi:two-component system sensor histidine kinase SaeS